jgi:UDP-N-acetylglucosamine 2-epimerase (non-hydrolysing)
LRERGYCRVWVIDAFSQSLFHMAKGVSSRLIPWVSGLIGLGLFFAAFSVYERGISSKNRGKAALVGADRMTVAHEHTDEGDFSCPQYFQQASKSEKGLPRVAIVFGTRPEAIKLTSVVSALRQTTSLQTVTVATGQHDTLLDTALAALSITPDISMKLMTPNQQLTSLGAKLMEHVGCALRQIKPAMVVVQGDTITATIASLAAFMQGIPVAHVEAGLRTDLPRDPYPEEVQRTGISSMATLHFTPTQYAADRLLEAGVCGPKISVVGNTVIDALIQLLSEPVSVAAEQRIASLGMPTPDRAELLQALRKGPSLPAPVDKSTIKWVIVTMHRRENFGHGVSEMISAVKALATMFPKLRFVIPVHPNPNVKDAITKGFKGVESVVLIEAQPYDVFIQMLAAADAVLTDSGGLQEESIALGKRLFVMRQATERPEALRSGLVTLVGVSMLGITTHVGVWAAENTDSSTGWPDPAWTLPPADSSVSQAMRVSARVIFGDGDAGSRIALQIQRFLSDVAISDEALRHFQSCQHNTNDPSSLVVSRADTDHMFHDMTWHEGVEKFLGGHQRFQHRVECSAQPPLFRETSRTLQELMALDSTYKPASPDYKPEEFGVTAIVSVYRRPQFFERFLWAMGNQTHKPTEVWITTFGSAHEDTFRQMLRQHDVNHTVFKFVSGDANYKYFGRFALAQMAKTPYVVLFDDDCIPGSRLFNNVLHTINIASGEYNGLIGMKGHGNIVEDPITHEQAHYFSHWEYRPDRTVPVDLTGGMWFLRTEWLRMMWRERPIPILGGYWETGEDFQLTYSLKKFLNLNTYLMANDWNDRDTWAHSHDYFDISSSGDTTHSNALYERSHILFGLFMKGYVPARAFNVWGEAHSQSNIVLILPSIAHAKQLAPIYHFLGKNFNDSIRVLPVVTVDPRADKSETRDAILKELSMEWNPRNRVVGVWDTDLQKMGSMRWRDTDVVVETQTALAGIYDTIRPALIISPFDEQSPVVLGAGVTAAAMKIPIVGFQPASDCSTRDIALKNMKSEPITMCAPLHALSFAKGTFNFVTNSPLLLVKHTVDTLCTCQQTSSEGVGAFAECPDIEQRVLISDFMTSY